MALDPAIVGTLFRAELRMVLRDRRILFTSIILPLLVTPLMFLGSHWSLQRRAKSLREMVYRYAVAGPEAGLARTFLAAARENLNRPDPSPSAQAPSNVRGHRRVHTNQTPKFRFEEVNCQDALASLNQGDVQLVVEAQAAGETPGNEPRSAGQAAARETKGKDGRSRVDDPESETRVAEVPSVRLIYRADRDDSAAALGEMQDALDRVRQRHRTRLLKVHGFPYTHAQLAPVEERDVASHQQVAGLALGRSLTLILLILVLTSGAVVATDSIAGEKERGTLETILSTAVNRTEILAAKSLVILAIALLITLIQSGNLMVYIGLKLLPVPANLAAAVTPGVGILLVALFLPVLALAASSLLLISGYARTYREAQMYFLPALLLGLLPGLAPFLPGLPLRSIVVLVPVANIALAAKEILIGSFDWPMIGLSWVVTTAAAVWMTRIGVRFLSTERLVTASGADAAEFLGGAALFERRVHRWFLVMWAALLVISNYFEKTDLRVQVLVNLVGLLFGSACLMIWHYGLDPRKALALRAPRPWVWLGVLLAVPGGLLTSLGLFQLTNRLLPVSAKLTESFDQSVLPPGVPWPQLVFFLTVLPAIFEEIAFRGLLLHGLHRRLRPVPLALAVGLAFGFFHFALFRFVPTASLGVMLAAVVLLTGSIYPAMLWHCLNNATGILMYRQQIPETDLPLSCYVAGVILLTAAFWIFWRNRTPYPGLRLGQKLQW